MVAKSFHFERHFSGSATVRDVIIGMSDGLTVPFALTAGLSGTIQDHWLIVIAGAAEIAAGAIAMGLGGFLAARSDSEYYHAELTRETQEIDEQPEREYQEVRSIFASYGLHGDILNQVTAAVTSNHQVWLLFMMREELGLEEPYSQRALISGLTIGLAYIAGGTIPLSPYILSLPVTTSFFISSFVTMLALITFGAIKGKLTGANVLRSAVSTLAVGGIAASAAYLLAHLITSVHS
jgi:VIT1/CCC1 family predicted Fe2+/Mn2+ transporter